MPFSVGKHFTHKFTMFLWFCILNPFISCHYVRIKTRHGLWGSVEFLFIQGLHHSLNQLE
jgi:hypothetical protein